MKNLGIIGAAIILVAFGYSVALNQINSAERQGSVSYGNEYKTKNISTITGSSTNATLLKTGVGTLGSVVFSTTSAQSFQLYDVAVASNYASTTLSTKILEFATGTPAGTYTFDVSTYKGLAVYAPITPTKEIIVTYR